jgi:3-isopropylmalate/(R)-2-methylmalate dehydratase small subunit
VDPETHQALFDFLEEVPRAELTVDLAAQTVTLPTGQTLSFPIDGFSKTCLLQGTDELGYLLSFADQIEAFERAAAKP